MYIIIVFKLNCDFCFDDSVVLQDKETGNWIRFNNKEDAINYGKENITEFFKVLKIEEV